MLVEAGAPDTDILCIVENPREDMSPATGARKGCWRQPRHEGLSEGSMANSCFKRSRAWGGIFEAHFLSRVSGLDMSGNFSPVNRGLRKKRWCCSSVSLPRSLFEDDEGRQGQFKAS